MCSGRERKSDDLDLMLREKVEQGDGVAMFSRRSQEMSADSVYVEWRRKKTSKHLKCLS